MYYYKKSVLLLKVKKTTAWEMEWENKIEWLCMKQTKVKDWKCFIETVFHMTSLMHIMILMQ